MDLNCTEEQKSAITAPVDKPVAIIACPGSGKTFTIIHRVAHLLQNGFKPSELLVITFTRKAAQELKTRLKSMHINISGITVQTFHSFGLYILRKYKHLLGIREFRIITQREQMEILESVAKATPNKEILLRLQIYKTQGQCEEELRPIFDGYNKTLRSLNACDFTDLIVLPLEILRRNPEVVNFYQRKYKYALVDEMQDVSKVQFDFMKLLFGDRGRLTVVGDDDQTIYSWRGADASLLLEFTKVYQEAIIIRLTNCFRCPPHIVKAMSKVIQNNKTRVKKAIESMAKPNVPSYLAFSENRKIKKITIYGANNPRDEAFLIATDLKRVMAAGNGTVAILFRTRKAAQYLKSEMAKQQVLASVYDRARFLEAEDVNIVLNILQMSVDMPFNQNFVKPNSLTIIRMYIVFTAEAEKEKETTKNSLKKDAENELVNKNLPSQVDLVSTSDDKEIKKENQFKASERKLLNTLSNDSRQFLNSDSDIDELDEIDSLINISKKPQFLSSDDDIDDDFIEEQLQQIERRKQEEEPSEKDSDIDFIKKSLRKKSPVDAINIIIKSLNMDKSDNISFLLKEANEMESFEQDDNSEQMDLIDFLYSVRTSTTEETCASKNIHMSTIHQAKGLEWDYVYIIGASQGSWPSPSSTTEGNEAKLEEERRLFYVAMSRAKKELTISFITDRGPSMFIDEIPSLLIKEKIHRKTDTTNDDKNSNDNGNDDMQSNKKIKFSPDQLKFKKVSDMADSQPMMMPNQFISASNLKLSLTSDSQNDAHASTPLFKDEKKDSSSSNSKKRLGGRPRLILKTDNDKTKQPKLNII